MNYKNWKYKVDDENIVWLYCDKENSATNSLNSETLEELDHLLDEFSQSKYKGIVIGSAKKTGFIAGADIEQFPKFKNFDEAFAFIKKRTRCF